MATILTEREVADLIGWSIHNARQARKEGRGPRPVSRRINRQVVYEAAEVRRWMAEHPHIVNRQAILESTIGVAEVARMLGKTEAVVRYWAKLRREGEDRGPPLVLASRFIRYEPKAVRAWARREGIEVAG